MRVHEVGDEESGNKYKKELVMLATVLSHFAKNQFTVFPVSFHSS